MTGQVGLTKRVAKMMEIVFSFGAVSVKMGSTVRHTT